MKKKKTIKYLPRKGGTLNKKNAPIFGKKIDEMMKQKGGKITSYELLKEAEKKTSVFHSYFEWDNTKAAKKYRMQQARSILESIVQVIVVAGKQSPQRSFFNVKDKKTKEKVYVTVTTAIAEPSYRRQLIDEIINHLENTTRLLSLFRENGG